MEGDRNLKGALLSLSILLLGTLQGQLPASSISGRVRGLGGISSVAANGAVTIGLNQIVIGGFGYRDGRKVFVPSTTIQVDSSGNYYIPNVKPGEYYVRAESLPLRGIATYYPGTLEAASATKFVVEAGQEIVGIDFDMVNPPMFKISGNVRNIPAATAALPNAILGITFASADPRSPDPLAGPLLQNTRAGANGEFEVSLPAGEWDLFPVIPVRAPGAAATPLVAGTPMYATGRARVRLADRNVESVVINVGSSDIKGRIVVAGGSLEQLALAVPLRINLLPRDNYPSPLISHVQTAQSVSTSGEFTFAAVPPGRYVVRILPIPSDVYLADMRVGSNSIYDDGVITVGTEPLDPVELTLRRGGGQVRVSVTGRDAAGAVGGSLRRIVLVPVEHRDNALLYRVTYVGSSNSESVSDVAPGRYKVFAFQELPPGGAEQNADFMAKYEDFGVTINVAAGQTVDVQVPWIPPGK
jgi:uncharacterized protein (DUF2141 family)